MIDCNCKLREEREMPKEFKEINYVINLSGICLFLTALFIFLKIFGAIGWSWIVCFLPIAALVLFPLIALSIVFGIIVFFIICYIFVLMFIGLFTILFGK